MPDERRASNPCRTSLHHQLERINPVPDRSLPARHDLAQPPRRPLVADQDDIVAGYHDAHARQWGARGTGGDRAGGDLELGAVAGAVDGAVADLADQALHVGADGADGLEIA